MNKKHTLDLLLNLLNTPSPSGYCHVIIDKITDIIDEMGYRSERTKKGNLSLKIAGENAAYTIGLSAHVDTLGAMVSAIKPNGMLAFTLVGGFTMHSVEGEYVKIHTRSGKVYTGTILNTEPSLHVYEGAGKQERKLENMEVRLDEVVSSREDVKKFGIMVGDFISLDARPVATKSGFVKSRHLDDKAGVVALLVLLKSIKEDCLTPKYNINILISTFEEVGHGAASIPWQVDEFIAIDMGAMGGDLTCTEKQVSICAKDSSGPYHYDVVSALIEHAQKNNIDFAVDVYPFYGSDASAAIKAGHDFKAGLIGPGVHASHHMERTHIDGIEQTVKLLIAYLCK